MYKYKYTEEDAVAEALDLLRDYSDDELRKALTPEYLREYDEIGRACSEDFIHLSVLLMDGDIDEDDLQPDVWRELMDEASALLRQSEDIEETNRSLLYP